jgi:NADH-quinone oxidoreductase subunit N
MNLFLTTPEIAVALLGLGLLLLDLWTPREQKASLGWVAAFVLTLILAGTLLFDTSTAQYAFGRMFVLDSVALFFKRLSLVAGILVILAAMNYAPKFEGGITEYYALTLFALCGMMWAASANHYALLFVSVELITVTFYVLAAFQRRHGPALESGVKYLILGGLASAFLVYGIALVYGATGAFAFENPAQFKVNEGMLDLYRLGLLLILAGLGFKIAAFPFQVWVPDVYQGAPTPTTAFLATGSKAAGFVLLLRVLNQTAPELLARWHELLMGIAAITIVYGNLCALPQRNLKRLLGYSGIANAGYLMLGVAALSSAGMSAVMFYLGGYVLAVLVAFTVLSVLAGHAEGEDIQVLAGLHKRSPMMAAILTLAMVSLAGIPPLAGFFGKFLLLKAVIVKGPLDSGYYWLAGIALAGVVVSLYYYFNVVRAIYWSQPKPEATTPIPVPLAARISLYACAAGILFIGVLPNSLLQWTEVAGRVLAFK